MKPLIAASYEVLNPKRNKFTHQNRTIYITIKNGKKEDG